MNSFESGHARVCITPPVGTRMGGYGTRKQGCAGVHDDLFCNVVALSDGDTTVLLLALDVAALDLAEVRELKAAVSRRTDVAPERILVNLSHTHAGPMVAHRPSIPFQADYFRGMVRKCAETAPGALADRRPAKLRIGRAPLEIGVNRREKRIRADGAVSIVIGVNPDGPRLPEVTAWRLEREDADDLVLFSAAVHATVLGSDNLLISGDWPGAGVREIESSMAGVKAVFLQGCAGNQTPLRDQRTFERVSEHGRSASAAVRQALAGAAEVSPLPLKILARDVPLPLRGSGAYPCPLRGLRLGEALLIGLGGEAFVEYALFLRGLLPAKNAMVLGYTDGSVGYLPIAQACSEGGYEIESNKSFPVGRLWDPQLESAIQSGLRAVVSELMA